MLSVLLRDGVELIVESIRDWGERHVELACFGTGDSARIVELVDDFCREHLDAGIRGYLFYHCSVGSAHCSILPAPSSPRVCR